MERRKGKSDAFRERPSDTSGGGMAADPVRQQGAYHGGRSGLSDTFFKLEQKWLRSASPARISARGCNGESLGVSLELMAFLRPDARLDVTPSHRLLRKCQVRASTDLGEIWSGILVRSGDEWLICRDGEDDDPAWRVQADLVRPGNYIFVHQPDCSLSFLISMVRDGSSWRTLSPCGNLP